MITEKLSSQDAIALAALAMVDAAVLNTEASRHYVLSNGGEWLRSDPEAARGTGTPYARLWDDLIYRGILK